MLTLMTVVRYGAIAVVALLALAALAAWAVQSRKLSPFGRPARWVRRLTDPLLVPIERRIVRAGGNPQTAPWWLLAGAVLGGILVVTLVRWALVQAVVLGAAAAAGPRALLRLLVGWTFSLIMLALIVRVVGSWVRASPYGRLMRAAARLTDWLLEPLRQLIPPLGPVDMTPLVAWLLLWFASTLVLGVL